MATACRAFPHFGASLWSGENSIGPRTFCFAKSRVYDSNGNRTKFVLRGLTGVIPEQRYVYDRQNRLTQIKDGGDSVIASYTYNAEGIRASKTVNGATTSFLLDGAYVSRPIGDSRIVDQRICQADDVRQNV